jgi:alkylhydroperoxidase family enzyme
MTGPTFLDEPAESDGQKKLYDDDLADDGYVWNVSRLWGHQPEAREGLVRLMGQAVRAAGLTDRQRGILVGAMASTLGDSYCSFAYGRNLTRWADVTIAAGVLTGDDSVLDEGEQALARWARQLARDPNGTTPEDVQALRDAGFDDAAILALTHYVALRLAFSTVNDALGAKPDHALADDVAPEVRAAVTWGRPAG